MIWTYNKRLKSEQARQVLQQLLLMKMMMRMKMVTMRRKRMRMRTIQNGI